MRTIGKKGPDPFFGINYDGQTNLTDFNLLASNFGLSATGPNLTPQDWSNLAAAVPEPAVMGVPCAFLAFGALRRTQGGRRHPATDDQPDLI
jgi:hypothetical protein